MQSVNVCYFMCLFHTIEPPITTFCRSP